jgi:CDP-4-dehydro-6-deoxyglucose reductase
MRVTFAGRQYQLRAGESVLEGMARHGVGVPSACRAGACHTCLLRAEVGDPGEAAQRGLKPALAARGYFLACQARPRSDLTVAVAGQDVMTPALLAGKRWLSEDVLCVRLVPQRPVSFRAGQHVTLDRGCGIIRVYSIASLPGEGRGLELHVRVRPGGTMSGWLASAPLGSALRVGVPAGECFYLPGSPEAALLLAGTGTGIAPLVAIARDALRNGHTGPVTIIHGSVTPAGLYLGERLPGSLAGAGTPVCWRCCTASRGEDITAAVTAEFARGPGPAATRAYLCGGTGSVASMRRALFLAGMSLQHIQADEFVPAVTLG